MELTKTKYKKTEVGLIPEDWEIKTVSQVAQLINGRAYKQEELLLKGKYRVLRVGNFFSNGNWYYSNLELPQNQYVERGDLMYAWSASFGPKFWLEEKIIYHYHIWKVITKENIDKTFLFHLLVFDKQEILKQTQGGTMFHITKGDMEERVITLPSTLVEQQAIASALSDMDELITNLEKLITKKKAIKQGAMQQLLTPPHKGGKRLAGFTGEWKENRLGDIIKYKGKTSHQSSYSLNDGIYPFFTNSSTDTIDKYFNEYDFNCEAIIANTGGVAHFKYYKGKFAAMADCYVFESKVNTKFLYYFLKINEALIDMTCFSGSGIKHLDKSYFAKIIFCSPEITEQDSIVKILSDMDIEIEALETKLVKTKSIKQGMMQELLTGKTRLV